MKEFESAKLRAVLVNALVDSFKNEVLNRKLRVKFVAFLHALEMEALNGDRPILDIREAQQLIDNKFSDQNLRSNTLSTISWVRKRCK